ncbi:DUF488 domain-containing protein [Scrofimicrobium sp. R131]|uniref:DUF488 domain-containing protein n=1 Tax=Scrofimicrobium appendicitidis TaxID=3079930 RepID=A0AAU7V922_9ACTO
MGEIRIKRVYQPAAGEDGYRVLVDRIWPRGESKEKAHLDLWLKEVAPSTELRKWFGHDPEKMAEFTRRYTAELENNPEAVAQLRELVAQHPVVTLVYSARDETDNQAVVLKQFLERQS